jgi:hypothetical protein
MKKEIILVDAELGEVNLVKSKSRTTNRRRMKKLKEQIKQVKKSSK